MIKPVKGPILSFCHLATLMPYFVVFFMPAFTTKCKHRAKIFLAALEFHSTCVLSLDSMGASCNFQ
jgi:hypothetical protein